MRGYASRAEGSSRNRREKEKVENEHEAHSNDASARLLMAGAAICLVIIALGYLGVATTPVDLLWRDFGIAALFLVVPFAYLRITKEQGSWFKYLVVACTIGAVIGMYSDFEISRHVITALFIPLIIASVYYDTRVTLITGIVTLALANVMDVINGATVFTPIESIDGRNVILVESPRIFEDLLFLDLGVLLVIAGFAVIAGRSRNLFNGLLQAEARIRQSANHDALTGLPNFSLFKQKMRQALARAQSTNNKMSS